MIRSKPLSMKQRFGFKKKFKCLYCKIWPSVSFYTKKKNQQPKFSVTKCDRLEQKRENYRVNSL